ncbi:hypothetical protein JCM19235_942 [Vibrio maritimus]|uniref:Uncharacterized protein n=1 Tax=Vibrio maritimus TaxID=990268 RepID=A0A090RWE8_9VIBR|nr:hypothetical protein JCM19235_942 [Vibrio maritimus]
MIQVGLAISSSNGETWRETFTKAATLARCSVWYKLFMITLDKQKSSAD